jgi:Ni/Fe-hydrogenase 1 B-type cytochrome subunit
MPMPKILHRKKDSIPLAPGENSETSFRRHRPPITKPIGNDTVKVYVWELPVRIWHWVNAISILVLMVTGIYIGKPFAGASIPEEAYYSNLMGWMRYIHFFAAFVFTANSIYRFYWIFAGNKYSSQNIFRLIFWKEMFETIKFYLFMKNKKPHYVGHNPLAIMSYILFIGIGSIAIIMTGFYLYFEPQPESFYALLFAWVPYVFGGDSYTIRSWHHLIAWAFIIFTVIHVYMAWRDDYLERNGTLSSICTGYKIASKKSIGGKDE